MTDPRSLFADEPVVDLSSASVAVLGCGSVGGLAAWCLASAGVGTLDLVDRDRLEAGNCRRHVCGRTEVGEPKVDALARFLAQHSPAATLTTHCFCLLAEPDRLRRLVERNDCLLAALDDEAPKHLLDGMARFLGRPVVHAGLHGGGWAAELILIDPTTDTPCYACTARSLGRQGVRIEPRAEFPSYALPSDCPPSQWVRADLTSIMPAAALAARLIVACLARSRGHDLPLRELLQPGRNAWRLGLRAVPPWGLQPWTLRSYAPTRQPECPVCGPHPDGPLSFDDLPGGEPS